jgi:hypothetical protein
MGDPNSYTYTLHIERPWHTCMFKHILLCRQIIKMDKSEHNQSIGKMTTHEDTEHTHHLTGAHWTQTIMTHTSTARICMKTNTQHMMQESDRHTSLNPTYSNVTDTKIFSFYRHTSYTLQLQMSSHPTGIKTNAWKHMVPTILCIPRSGRSNPKISDHPEIRGRPGHLPNTHEILEVNKWLDHQMVPHDAARTHKHHIRSRGHHSS